jgi:hypothetical protein
MIAAEYDIGLDHGAYGVVAERYSITLFPSASTATTFRASRALRGRRNNHGFNAAYAASALRKFILH